MLRPVPGTAMSPDPSDTGRRAVLSRAAALSRNGNCRRVFLDSAKLSEPLRKEFRVDRFAAHHLVQTFGLHRRTVGIGTRPLCKDTTLPSDLDDQAVRLFMVNEYTMESAPPPHFHFAQYAHDHQYASVGSRCHSGEFCRCLGKYGWGRRSRQLNRNCPDVKARTTRRRSCARITSTNNSRQVAVGTTKKSAAAICWR
jgi:hypothetical protein